MVGLPVHVRLPAVPPVVSEVRVLVREAARAVSADPQWLGDVGLAVTEALANVVRHAYSAADGVVDVDADREDGEFVVTVRDYGVGVHFDPPTGGSLGVGLAMMRLLADHCRIEPAHPGTRVTMRFAAPATPP